MTHLPLVLLPVDDDGHQRRQVFLGYSSRGLGLGVPGGLWRRRTTLGRRCLFCWTSRFLVLGLGRGIGIRFVFRFALVAGLRRFRKVGLVTGLSRVGGLGGAARRTGIDLGSDQRRFGFPNQVLDQALEYKEAVAVMVCVTAQFHHPAIFRRRVVLVLRRHAIVITIGG